MKIHIKFLKLQYMIKCSPLVSWMPIDVNYQACLFTKESWEAGPALPLQGYGLKDKNNVIKPSKGNNCSSFHMPLQAVSQVQEEGL